jgi:hypothetical protein
VLEPFERGSSISMSRILNDYSEFLEALQKTLIEKVNFIGESDLKRAVEQPRLVVALNHATPLSWIPAITTLALETVKAGGGDRTPRGVVDRWFYNNPLTNPLAEYLTQSKVPQNFEDLLQHFSESEKTDLVIFPEGAHSFFGDLTEIQKFRSGRFVELALRAQAPILVVAHRGSENWSRPLQLPEQMAVLAQIARPLSPFFARMLSTSQVFNLPKLPRKIVQFQMSCALYEPSLGAEGLSLDLSTRKSQLDQEAEKIRQQMREMLRKMPG